MFSFVKIADYYSYVIPKTQHLEDIYDAAVQLGHSWELIIAFIGESDMLLPQCEIKHFHLVSYNNMHQDPAQIWIYGITIGKAEEKEVEGEGIRVRKGWIRYVRKQIIQ